VGTNQPSTASTKGWPISLTNPFSREVFQMSVRPVHSSAKILTSSVEIANSNVTEFPGVPRVWQPRPRSTISLVTAVMNSPLSQLTSAKLTGFPPSQ
jgi:hypothetical protein